MSKEKQHDKVLDDLVKRLQASGRYFHIETKYEYFTDDVCLGEMDVVALTHNLEPHLYEVKGNHNRKAYKHAKEQLQRSYEKYNWVVKPKLIYHSPQHTERIYFDG